MRIVATSQCWWLCEVYGWVSVCTAFLGRDDISVGWSQVYSTVQYSTVQYSGSTYAVHLVHLGQWAAQWAQHQLGSAPGW